MQSAITWLLVLAACGLFNHSALAKNSLPELMAGMAPDNWELYGQVRRFGPVDLYELINGAAELYLAYELKDLTFASYISKNDKNIFMDVSVYDMGDPTNAFGIFSVERFSSGPSIGLGRKAYRSEGNLFIWHGHYYIKIVSSDHTKELEALGRTISRKIIGFLIDSGQPVWGLSNLPRAGLIPDTIKYFRADAMGLNFLSNTYTARYFIEGAEITAFVSLRDSIESAGKALKAYMEYAAEYGQGCTTRKADETEIVLCGMDGDFDAIFTNGLLVVGVTSVQDGDLAVKAAAAFKTRFAAE